jgi:polyphosphate kinase
MPRLIREHVMLTRKKAGPAPGMFTGKGKSARARTRQGQPAAAAASAFTKKEKGLIAHAWRDRDLGWLDFNRRVLHEALDARTPLLERLKFLAIFGSNLDEFFMKRIALLRTQARSEGHEAPAGREHGAREMLHRIRASVLEMIEAQARCYQEDLLPALAAHGIVLSGWDDLNDLQKEEAAAYFDRNVSPALTPLSFDPTHPFPFMSNLSTNWGFVLKPDASDELVPVRVKIPTMLPQWVPLEAGVAPGEMRFLHLDDLVLRSAGKLFPGMQVVDATLFRILRNAEIDLDEDQMESLRDSVTEAVRQRRFQPVVRVDFAPSPNPTMVQSLVERFGLTDIDVYELPGLLDYSGLFQIAALDVPELRDPHWSPQPPARLADEDTDIFGAIQAGDILLHHPYDSFDMSVEDFIRRAADDPQTVAVKMTVYRVGDDTPFVRSLIRAAETGKQVACVIELKARFDEARNLVWAQELEKAGAHVTYGVVGLKTHTKVALVVRKEGRDLRCYAHVATGNYHVKTARLYTDVGLLTCDPTITADVVKLFHYLTGRSGAPHFQRLLVAPVSMRARFLDLIEREIAHQSAGRPARIIAKMNQVQDAQMCQALSAASQAGVRVDLIVRGFCCLVPGVPGWTDNVHVRSIIGRFLEHSRVFYFANGSDDPLAGEFLIGSADWMYRNLSRRVEAAVPIEDPASRERLWNVLQVALADSRQAWEMQSDGSYRQLVADDDAQGPARLGTHAWTMAETLTHWSGE